jgi:alpha-mannosidase
VFRRWIEIPETIHGYATRGVRVMLDLGFATRGIVVAGLTITVFSNGVIVYRGDDDNLQPVLLSGEAQPGQKLLIAVRVVAGSDVQWEFTRSELTIETPASRPDPGLLRMDILAARPIISAYEEGKAEREQQLDAAVKAIDFAPLDKGDEAGFDASLRQAQVKLEALKPWLQRFTIRAVGNSHIDMAWLWPWTETVEVVRNTFQSVLDLMREYPDFKFTMSSARTYEWMQEKYPDLFEQIQQRVKEGRWEIIGGMWVEPDLNMPDGESLTRQILVGKRYFQKNFGVDVKIGWNPDSFGYNWQLPQIYKKSGMDYFVTQKLLWAHEFTTFPYKLFWWQAPDGSRLLTYFPHDYAGGIDAEPLGKDLSIWMPSIYGKTLSDHPQMMHLYGVGDHGGGPTRVMLDNAEKLKSPQAVFPKLEFSFASGFFGDLEKKLPGMQVPTWNGELYFQYHRGVFTTQAETKRRIRRAEEAVLDAEKFASLASLYGRTYPQEGMEQIWKNLLFDHFHDIMPGSGIAVNYLDAKRNLENVDRAATDITRGAMREIAAHVDTRSEGVPLIVFNSLSWPRSEIIEAEAQLPAPAAEIQVFDASGKTAESQLLAMDKETHRARFLLAVEVPAMGYRVYFVRGAARGPVTHSILKASGDLLENEFVRVKIDPQSGCMTSLVDKRSGSEALAPAETDTGGPKNAVCGNLLQTFIDKPKQWDAWNIDADFEAKHWDLDHADEVKLAESGPLRAVIRIRNHFQNSTFIRDVTLYAGAPRVDVKMQTEWHEKHILLKVAFPLSAHNDNATYEIPYGTVERPTTRNTPGEQAQFEVPGYRWGDISDAKHGFSLLNDCKYGYDAKGNVLRLSLLRSPEWPDPHADEGHHEFTYSLYPHGGGWREALTVRRGYELNYKLFSMQTAKHEGALAAEHSFVKAQPENIVVTALKKAEDDDGLILRFYEWAGKETDVRIEVPPGMRSAEETNLMEARIGDLPFGVDSVVVHTKPYEIKTVRVEFGSARKDSSAP